jgi:hypothetical protein
MDRGFDDPQADPNMTFHASKDTCGTKQDPKPCHIYISYKRADRWNFPNPDPTNPIFPYETYANDTKNGNPPWGSQPSGDALSNPPNDNDADGAPDPTALTDRHNRGSFAAYFNSDRYAFAQQPPDDALAEPSHPVPAPATCDPYSQDCGGLALYASRPDDPATGNPYDAYPSGTPPPAPETWPLVPFPRDWAPYKSTDSDSKATIKRLLRFASSIVSFDSTKDHMSEYRLEESARDVVVISPGTPIAGSLRDAYNYFKNSVFQQNDPFATCRLHKIVLITDGLDSSGADSCSGGPNSGKGPAGDLGQIQVPVVVVSLGQTPDLLNCIAANSGGPPVILASDRTGLQTALEGLAQGQIPAGVTLFSAPALPALTSSGDEAIIGGVVPSHSNPPAPDGDGSATSWAIWNGSLKAYKLDSNGDIPTVTAAATPSGATPTPTPTTGSGLIVGFPDQSDPNNADPTARRPVWNAARVLGYTDPVASLTGAADPAATTASTANLLPIAPWPGRRMVWGEGTGPAVPLTRKDFMPNSGNCTGTNPNDCFADLMLAMGFTDPTDAIQKKNAVRTVQFFRGGKTSITGSRDEILTDIGTDNPGTYGTVNPNTIYSYRYQDDPPVGNDPALAQTDGLTNPKGYAHKLGDIFHSEAVNVLPPKYFQFLSGNVTPRTPGACGTLPDCSYGAFAAFHSKRRRVIFVGANDGFLHAFDAGVWGRDTDPDHGLQNNFDLGTGREIFAYAPTALMNPKFPGLLNFPPKVQYFVDGSPVVADVFIDTAHSGTPSDSDRTWKTILVSGLRQGGHHYFALDVTQPDQYASDGTRSAGNKDSSPDCLDGGGNCAGPYPTVLWELTDNVAPAMGETWSRPVVGRIKVSGDSGPGGDRYVAIFGGGFDASFIPGTKVKDSDTTQGRAIYIVNVETGRIIYKATSGKAAGGTDPIFFAPMPAPPAVVDVDDDGYLDLAYIGDLNGRMWRLDLRTGDCGGCDPKTETLTFPGPQPFLLYDAMSDTQPIQPIFLDAGIIFVSGGASPILGIAFGTGYRADLLQANPNVNRFYFVLDPGANAITFNDQNLNDITPKCDLALIPEGCATGEGKGPQQPAAVACNDSGMTNCGYFLNFAGADEKTTSTVNSTLGNLALVTFKPNSTTDICGNGTSLRYSFFFANGKANQNQAFGAAGDLKDYRETLGAGVATAAGSQAPNGDMIDTVLFSGGGISQENKPSTLKTISQSWKEQ